MRWFKHLVNSWEDEKLADITIDHGLEIYGFWWRVLEIIAKQMDSSQKTNCKYPAKVWGRFCGVSAIKFRKLAGVLAKAELIILKNSENDLDINIPNLVKIRDEYTEKKDRKSG